MLPLFDMFMNAQNGEALSKMANQFNLSQKQTEEALAALMPAFSAGLKRNASDPMGVGAFLSALAAGSHAKYFEDMTKAFTPAGIDEGNGILGHIFGNKDVSRAVAAQAAQATGIGQEIFKQMLPVIASTMMGGLYKQSTGQMNVDSDKPLVRMMQLATKQQGEWAEELGLKHKSAGASANPFMQAMEQMFGAGMQGMPGMPGMQGGASANPMNNPFTQAMAEMMKAGVPKTEAPAPPEPEPEAEPDEAPEAKAANPYGDLFGDMFETGRRTQESYQRSMEQIFDTYMQGMKRPG